MPDTADNHGSVNSVVAVVGATASGKSELALDLAERLGGEIVNTDAIQVYRGMDVGTAKLPPGERRGIPHHLLDLLDVSETASVAEFQRLARDVIDDCTRRGVVPVLVGGSALYTRAILDEFEFPGTDPELRARHEAELARLGAPALHARLTELDPVAAAGILPSNGRRIVRALEVIELTGGPYGSTLPEHTYIYPGAVQLGLDVPRPVLDERIGRRVDRMFENGFVDEVKDLLGKGLLDGVTAHRALGYAPVIAMLKGELSEAQARERTAQTTRRFARRQDGWFRRDPRITWLPWDAPDLVEQALRVVRGNHPDPGGVVKVEGARHV
jgi:tRNA dimethylallyltransferase